MGRLHHRSRNLQMGIHPALHGGRHPCLLVQGTEMEGNPPPYRQRNTQDHNLQRSQHRIHSQFRIPEDRGIRPLRVHHQELRHRKPGARRHAQEKGLIRQGSGHSRAGKELGYAHHASLPGRTACVQVERFRGLLRGKDVETVRGEPEFQPLVAAARCRRTLRGNNVYGVPDTRQVPGVQEGGRHLQRPAPGDILMPEDEKQMEILPVHPAYMADVLAHERSHHERDARARRSRGRGCPLPHDSRKFRLAGTGARRIRGFPFHRFARALHHLRCPFRDRNHLRDTVARVPGHHHGRLRRHFIRLRDIQGRGIRLTRHNIIASSYFFIINKKVSLIFDPPFPRIDFLPNHRKTECIYVLQCLGND